MRKLNSYLCFFIFFPWVTLKVEKVFKWVCKLSWYLLCQQEGQAKLWRWEVWKLDIQKKWSFSVQKEFFTSPSFFKEWLQNGYVVKWKLLNCVWILQARILEWVAFPFCKGSSQPRDQTQVSCILYQLSHKGSPRILEWVVYPFSRGSSQPRSQA